MTEPVPIGQTLDSLGVVATVEPDDLVVGAGLDEQE